MVVQIEGKHPVRGRELSQSVGQAGRQADGRTDGRTDGQTGLEGQSFSDPSPSPPPRMRARAPRPSIHSTWLRRSAAFGIAHLRKRLSRSVGRSVGLPSASASARCACLFETDRILSWRNGLVSKWLSVPIRRGTLSTMYYGRPIS